MYGHNFFFKREQHNLKKKKKRKERKRTSQRKMKKMNKNYKKRQKKKKRIKKEKTELSIFSSQEKTLRHLVVITIFSKLLSYQFFISQNKILQNYKDIMKMLCHLVVFL